MKAKIFMESAERTGPQATPRAYLQDRPQVVAMLLALPALLVLMLVLLVLLALTVAPCMAQSSAGTYTQSFNIMGTAPYTKLVPVTDVSQLLTTAYDALSGTDGNWLKIKAVLITCEDNDVRVSFGVAAGQGATRKGHILAIGQSLRIPSADIVKKTYIINKTNGSAGNLMVTVEY